MTSRITVSLVLLCCMVVSSAWARSHLLSQHQGVTTSQVDSLNNMASGHYAYREQLRLARLACKQARIMNYEGGEARAHQTLGTTFWSHSDYIPARLHLDSALKLYRKLSLEDRIAECQNTLGLSFYYTSDYQNAIDYLDSALSRFLVIGDSSNISRVYNNLSLVHQTIGEFKMSTDYLIKGIQYKLRYIALIDQSNFDMNNSDLHGNRLVVGKLIEEKRMKLRSSQDQQEKARSIAELGTLFQLIDEHDSAFYFLEWSASIYDSLGQVSRYALDMMDIGDGYRETGNLDRARETYLKIWQPLLSERMIPTFGNLLTKLGRLEAEMGNQSNGVQYFHQAVWLNDSVGHRASVGQALNGLAQLFLEMSKFDSAEHYALRGYELSSSLGSFRLIKQAAQNLSEVYEKQGRSKQAIKFARKYFDMSLAEKDHQALRATREFEARFELNEKSRTIDQMGIEKENQQRVIRAQKNTLVAIGLGVLVAMVLMVLLYLRYSRIRSLKKQLEEQNASLLSKNTENEILIKEIHHRVKNNLQMISSLLSLQNRRIQDPVSKNLLSITKNRIRSIGLIHEHLYTYHSFDVIKMDVYIRDLVEMMIKSLHSGIPIQVTFDLAEVKVKLDVALPIGLMINELITNSIKYAFDEHAEPALQIELTRNNQSWILCVRDNGKTPHLEEGGFGWSIIKTTVDSLEGSVTSSTTGGLKVEVRLPIRE